MVFKENFANLHIIKLLIMKLLKQILILFTISIFFSACGSASINSQKTKKEEPVIIANERLEYKIIIIEGIYALYHQNVKIVIMFYLGKLLLSGKSYVIQQKNLIE